MNQRTYEIISKYVAEENGVKIRFEEGVCPHAILKEKAIVLPTNIEANDPWAALSTLIHEAAHIKYSVLPKSLSRNAVRHNLLNAIEDVRIDHKNFYLLPNVMEWYRRSAKEQVEERAKMDMTKVSHEKKVLVNGIYEAEGLFEGVIPEPAVTDFCRNFDIPRRLNIGADQIDRGDWAGVEKSIDELIKILALPDPPNDPNAGGYIVGVPAGQEGKEGDGDGEVLNISGLIAGLGKAFKSAPGDGTTMGGALIGAGVVTDLTKHKFKELLNVKEKKVVYEGNNLNHDNLVLFHLGELEELFLDDDIVKKKKSKMMFLIDASGSMGSQLMCGATAKEVTLGTVRHLVEVLRDVMAEDSLDVDYQIAAFTGDYHPLSKDNWEKEYSRVSGGTSLGDAFKKAMLDMMSDTTIDGSRTMILFTDGDVYDDDIRVMEDCIKQAGKEVKYLLIGVGSDISCDYVTKIIGDNNILTRDSADVVLMDAIAGII